MDPMQVYAWQEEYTLHEAACLLLDQEPFDPSSYADDPRKSRSYKALLRTLRAAVCDGHLSAMATRFTEYASKYPAYVDEHDQTQRLRLPLEGAGRAEDDYAGFIDASGTVVRQQALAAWVEQRGINGKFADLIRVNLVPSAHTDAAASLGEAPYADPNSEFFAPKLNAAVAAHVYIARNPTVQKGRSHKQAIKAFLVENGERLGIANEGGEVPKATLEAIAMVANAQPQGGTPKY
ncbi:hypothetical protein [Ferrimonas marina]|uniref:Uncharacterized protein n=1 Tax=Ferrimonas marina TaxID=299255 RepID=A0A1M5X816_9GAMM|nr:hypothetical protein [Ferrimonas marina]SHH95931.1 hypothetical protein SAMN02745129_3314 [Ferrimonas marina]